MNRGWCRFNNRCRLHHPEWGSDEHWDLQVEYNKKTGRDWYGNKWDSGWSWRNQDDNKQEEDRWRQDPQQETSHRWKEANKGQAEDQEPKVYVFRDHQNWHNIKLRITDPVIASIERDKSRTNRDTEELLARITEAAMDLVDNIHNKR